VPGTEILVVEDEPNLSFIVSAALRLAGYSVVEVATGQAALTRVAQGGVELLLLDVMLPDINGFDICRRLRAGGSDLPVVFLTARDATDDRVRGLTIGGDDYLTKPFSVEEMIARVQAVLRRSGKSDDVEKYRCGDLTLDDSSHMVNRAGEVFDLSPTEYKLLRFLLRHPGKVLTKGQILDHVWDYDFVGESTVVETYISSLRKKLDFGQPRLIQTVRGIGYRMTPP
jgi:two-component system OmpR family response regulator